jgi:3D-(3,5/4)-trihydroxycyclohexane-1,2-dione acylhydrolase (decyclizing)
MGASAVKVSSISELEQAFLLAKSVDRTTAIVINVQAQQWTPGGAWWDIGVPEVSDRREVREAHARIVENRQHQRVGV